jgi:hypothetical protein
MYAIWGFLSSFHLGFSLFIMNDGWSYLGCFSWHHDLALDMLSPEEQYENELQLISSLAS